MRIISGKYRGRRINAPQKLVVRPTTDVAKESLFNIINNYFNFDSLKVLDIFSGIGSISYEFASRGAIEVTSVDIEYNCVKFIKKTIADFNIDNIKVLNADAFKFLKYSDSKFDIIFADPPYNNEKFDIIPSLVFDNNLLNNNGWLIIEHPIEVSFIDYKYFFEHRKYGKVNFSIFCFNE